MLKSRLVKDQRIKNLEELLRPTQKENSMLQQIATKQRQVGRVLSPHYELQAFINTCVAIIVCQFVVVVSPVLLLLLLLRLLGGA